MFSRNIFHGQLMPWRGQKFEVQERFKEKESGASKNLKLMEDSAQTIQRTLQVGPKQLNQVSIVRFILY